MGVTNGAVHLKDAGSQRAGPAAWAQVLPFQEGTGDLASPAEQSGVSSRAQGPSAAGLKATEPGLGLAAQYLAMWNH